jgi:hypothetical protein
MSLASPMDVIAEALAPIEMAATYTPITVKYVFGFEQGCHETWCGQWEVEVRDKYGQIVSWRNEKGMLFMANRHCRDWKEVLLFLAAVKLAKEKGMW